jgi:ATP-dependent protease ClpP protease subunit
VDKKKDKSDVSVWYDGEKATVRVHGYVNNEVIFQLCDEVNLAVDYYNYRRVEIQIDSEAGAVSSLEYYLAWLEKWRKTDKFTIETLALTKAASAGAMILSTGSIGCRRAFKSTRLLYHDARIYSSEGEVWTKDKLWVSHRQLESTDERVMQYLVQHVFAQKVVPGNIKSMLAVKREIPSYASALDPNEILEIVDSRNLPHLQKSQILESYTRLTAFERFIPAELAQEMLLIDQVVAYSSDPEEGR